MPEGAEAQGILGGDVALPSRLERRTYERAPTERANPRRYVQVVDEPRAALRP